jgi:uncharacterized protein YegL
MINYNEKEKIMETVFDPTKFTVSKAKPLPVLLLLDVSGSMGGSVGGESSKIQVLNEAVKQMIDSFADEEKMETEFLVSIIKFGGNAAENHLMPTSASTVNWTNMTANGGTPMGDAFSKAKLLIEDKEVIPSRAYRPTVVLVSDGVPTDSWEAPLESLIKDGRSSKCFFMAMGIGEEPGMIVLEKFISQTPVLAEVNGNKIQNKVFHAEDAKTIREFFRKVTMSVTTRSKSQNPNNVPASSSNSTEEDGGYW